MPSGGTYIGELTGVWYKDVTLPEEVWQAKTMELSWHNQEGKLQVCPTSVGIYVECSNVPGVEFMRNIPLLHLGARHPPRHLGLLQGW